MPLPPALLLDEAGRASTLPAWSHVLLPAGSGHLVCDLCGLVFGADALHPPQPAVARLRPGTALARDHLLT